MNNKQESVIESTYFELRTHWKTVLFHGILFTILGLLAVLVPVIFSIAFEQVIGWLFLIGGAIQFYRCIEYNQATGYWMMLLSSLFAMIFGVLFIFHPLEGIVALTTVIALYFLAEGLVKIILAYVLRESSHWGWFLLSGLCSIAISVIAFSGLPFTASWFIGTLIGVYLIINGLSYMIIAIQAHRADIKSGK
jgi:uncharacterized membrane protein HdeD (DUF308 family)